MRIAYLRSRPMGALLMTSLLMAALLTAASVPAQAANADDATSAARLAETPRRVMSLNACTDVLALRLLPPERIVSVTFLTHESRDAALRALAAGVGSNRGTAEEVLSASPDLVLAGIYTTPAARMILARLHIPTLTVPPANNFESIRSVTRLVAAALGESTRAESMLNEMDATLRQLASTAPAEKLRVAAWDGGGSVPAGNSLFDAILTAAGGTNIARSATDEASQFDVEDLLTAHPNLLLYGDSAADGPSLRDLQTQHPAIRRIYAGRTIKYPEALYSCGEPASALAAVKLRRALLDLSANR